MSEWHVQPCPVCRGDGVVGVARSRAAICGVVYDCANCSGSGIVPVRPEPPELGNVRARRVLMRRFWR